jgi:hypothetical protein
MPHRIAWLALLLALVCAPAGPPFAQAAPDTDPDEIGEPDEPRGRGGREGRRAGREERRAGREERRAVREAARQKEVACRRDAARQNLRQPEARDFATICVAEARLACLKRSVEARVRRGPTRRDYIARCLGEI